jgi:hypothetical protein
MDEKIPAGSSVWVLPGWDNYPLMYHAPQFVYAWQLANPPQPQFMGLDAIHFMGVLDPDYMIAFGPYVEAVRKELALEHARGTYYDEVAVLNRYWANIHRPAVIHHAFVLPEKFDLKTEAIHIFRRRPRKEPELPINAELHLPVGR